jgi:predicted RNA-binding Zn-ribbon protein involved in translation (DUF1610 family)
MTTSVEPVRDCPSCGQTLTGGEKSCPKCGKETPEVTKKPARAKKTPSKVAKVECPHCGELVSKRSRKCPACMTNLAAGFYKVSDKSVVEEIAEPKKESAEQVVQLSVGEANICSPSSPMFLEKPEPEHQEPIAAPEVATTADGVIPAESPPAKEQSETVPGQEEAAGPVVPLGPAPAKEQEMKTDEPGNPVELATPPESMPPGVSSVAGATTTVDVQPIVSSDPLPAEIPPSNEVVMASVDPVPVDPLPLEPSKTIEDNTDSANGPPQINIMVAQASCETVASAEDSKSRGMCEAIVPKSSQVSLADFMSAIEKEHLAEQVQPTAEPLKAQPQAESGPPVDNSQSKPVRLIRKRKLKVARSTAAPVTAPADVVNGVRDPSNLGEMIVGNAGNQPTTK